MSGAVLTVWWPGSICTCCKERKGVKSGNYRIFRCSIDDWNYYSPVPMTCGDICRATRKRQNGQ